MNWFKNTHVYVHLLESDNWIVKHISEEYDEYKHMFLYLMNDHFII